MMRGSLLPRRSVYGIIASILPEKNTSQIVSAVCFACVFLIFSAATFSVQNKDLLLNQFRSSPIVIEKQLAPSSDDHKPRLQKADSPTTIELSTTNSSRQHDSINDNKPLIRETKKQAGNSTQTPADIVKFWKKLTQAPRVVQCTNISCTSQHRQQPTPLPSPQNSISSTCPLYFQWIYEDLAPWMQHGISLELLQDAKQSASFRVVISNGRLFVEPYRSCYQTRSLFTIWGLLQLLDYHPGLVPDVDIMFSCDDRPVIRKKAPGIPAPVFRYCSTKDFWDIPFPDWSFWGWSEINIGPWEQELSSIVEASKQTKWADRNPTAYWKGNPHVAKLRQELLKCNGSEYGTQIYIQDWIKEGAHGFRNSKLADQCKHRYKIYAEGYGWSVSLKYILACNSVSLLITPAFHDFFSRGLVPRVSYWPVRYEKMCDSLKFAVDWGNKDAAKAEKIGNKGQEFMAKEVSMQHVYDYMLHVLIQYAKLQRFKPGEMVGDMREVCSEEILCSAQPTEKRFMQQSKVSTRSGATLAADPCILEAQNQSAANIQALVKSQRLRIRQIEKWEDEAFVRH